MVQIDKNRCNSCNKCVRDCTAHAIDIRHYTVSELCIFCGHCVAICPQSAITMNGNAIVDLQPQRITPQDFRTLCAHTRSCRSFERKPIDPEVLRQLAEITAHAPSASNVRGVELSIVANPDLLKTLNTDVSSELLKMFRLLTLPVIKQVIQVLTSKAQVYKLEKYVEKFTRAQREGKQNISFGAPAVVLFHARHETLGMLETDASIWASYCSLYASSFGLGTCFNGFIAKAFGKNKSLQTRYGIPKSHKVYIALMLGYPTRGYLHETSRNAAHTNIV
ncbi:MAG: nitroreductase family protein [Bacteroidales bacterium]|jgi:nitroreductase/NAD-dependent dihydropyrimidine dehydrogenase PreA subunit|nr:nitroreductase family protein [Bacteroidales bacterium]